MEQTVEHCEEVGAKMKWGELRLYCSFPGTWWPSLPPSLGMAAWQP